MVARFQAVLCAVLFILIVLGAAVRLANAGLACPDWPLCNGELVPKFNFQIFMEWTHRAVAMSVGILALVNAILIFQIRKDLVGWILGSLFLFAIQAFLGRQTVIELLRPEIVNSHLMGGYLLFAVNLLIYCRLKNQNPVSTAGCYSKILLSFAIFTFFQATVGGTVSSHYAGLVCPDFPSCIDGVWWPAEGLRLVKMLHRYGAFILLASVWILNFSKKIPVPHRRFWRVLAILLPVQIGIGISMVFSQIHPALSLAHSLFSISIFSLFVWMKLQVWREVS